MSTDSGQRPFAVELRHLRVTRGLTQLELAERAGLSLNAISALERGDRRYPYAHTVQAIADTLGLVGPVRESLVRAASRTRTAATVRMPREAGLPEVTTSLVGRDAEIDAAEAMLRNGPTRLLTLTGPGGVGKTRLALQIASRLPAQDGARFISLVTVTEPAQVIPAIADALGVGGTASRLDELRAFLDDRDLVLVLDNVEQVPGAAATIGLLMQGRPRLRLIVTSRTPLHLSGEQEFPVHPLTVPSTDDDLVEAATSPAVQLFVQRAQSVRPGFTLTPGNESAIVAICRQLDGLPLAIELAASRVRLLSPQAMLRRMGAGLGLMFERQSNRPVRHQSLWSTIDWSYALLSSDEQALFRILSVFSGGCSLDAVESVALALSRADTLLDRLTALIEHSLLRQEVLPSGDVRLSMLSTIRIFGLEHLKTSEEFRDVSEAHAEHFRTQLSALRAMLEGPGRREAHAAVRRDLDNMRAALDWSIEAGNGPAAQRMANELGLFWIAFGMLDEARRAFERVNALPGTDESRFLALYRASIVAQLQDQQESARSLADQSLEAARAHGDPVTIGTALAHIGDLLRDEDPDAAEALVMQSIELIGKGNHPFLEAVLHRHLALIAMRRDHTERARREHETALDLWQRMDHRWGVPISLRGLAEVALASDDLVTARQRYLESLTCWQELNEKVPVSDCLLGLAQVHSRLGNAAWAAALIGQREALDRAMGYAHLDDVHGELIAHLQEELGVKAFERAHREGGHLTLDAMLQREKPGSGNT